MHHNKLEEEKKDNKDKAKKKKQAQNKPMISQSKGLDSNLRNNNPAMINDLTGADDDYYDEEDYGQEVDNSKRVPEEEYDFM